MNNDNKIEYFCKRLEEAFQVETRYAITMAIRTFGSLNTKMLSRMLGKTESTIWHHCNELLKEPKIIEIDQDKTESQRGKFFKLTEKTKVRYREDPPEVFEEKIPEILNKWLECPPEEFRDRAIQEFKQSPELGKIANNGKRALAYHHTMANFTLNNFKKAENAILDGFTPVRKDFPLGSYTLVSSNIKISSPKHSMKIGGLLAEFFGKLQRLRDEIEEEMKIKNVSEKNKLIYHCYFFGGEVNEFNFE